MSTFPVPDAARGATMRARTLATVSCLACATALLASLSACGGGGGGGAVPAPPPAPAPAPTPAPTPSTPIAAQMTVPAPVGYDAQRLAAFNRLNEIRVSAGLGMVAQNALLDQAAQAHAEWMIANDAFVHEETPGTTGFTGVHFWDRDEALGYVPVGGDEVMSSGARASAGVDLLVNMLYHRIAILAFEPVDVGVGWSNSIASAVRTPLVIDLTRPGTDPVRGFGQAAQERIQGVAIWPLDGSRGVPTLLGDELPSPVPGQDESSLGTPVSIMVDHMQTIGVSSFTMTNATSGESVPTFLLTSETDPNRQVPRSFVALIPLAPLSVDTLYRVRFVGHTAAAYSGDVADINRTWSFVTAGL